MSEAAERYAEKRGWNQQRSMAYRRNVDQKEKEKLRRLERHGIRQGMLSDSIWDWNAMDSVPRGWVKRYYFPGIMRFSKKMARRKVRRSDEIASGNSYKKEYDLIYDIW